MRALPSPRDESALALLRAARSLVRGSAPAPSASLPASRAKLPSPGSLSGRWLRVPVQVPPPAQVPERETHDPAEAAAVRAGWLLVDAYERLSSKAARRVFGHEIDAWKQYADETIPALASPPGRIMVDVEESRANRVRYRRTLDFAQKNDRVFDVGFGRGYLAAQLIRERGISRYHGIDIIDTWVNDSYELLEANGLAGADIVLERGDLFELTKEQLEATQADLVICCEVLEHVDDAEKALKILADALPDGADLLFSVPLHGRLEQVWGHATVFDVARLKGMLDGAGLYVHHVEPLANTWTLIVASRQSGPSSRVRDASGRPAVRVSRPLSREHRFVDVPAGDLTALARPSGTSTVRRAGELGTVCDVTTDGGVSFPVSGGLESLRLAFEFVDCDQLLHVDVVARAGTETAASWRWKPSARRPATGRRKTWFRPGEASDGFVPGPHGALDGVDSVEVIAHVATGRTASLGLAAAYLP